MATYKNKWGSRGSIDGKFLYPTDVAVDVDFNTYIVDEGNARIQKFKYPYLDEETQLIVDDHWLLTFNAADSQLGPLVKPYRIESTSEPTGTNFLYVLDLDRPAIFKFTNNGAVATVIVSDLGSNPIDISVGKGANHKIFVLDNDEFSPNIRIFSALGIIQEATIPLAEAALAIAVDSSDNVWVSLRSQKIEKYSIDGVKLLTFGNEGTGNGEFNDVKGMFVDSSNSLYVADTNNYRIQKFDSLGNFLEKFGVFGSAEGQFNNPSDVTISTAGNIYIADKYNYRIQKFLADNPPDVPENVRAKRNPINNPSPILEWDFTDPDDLDQQTAFQLQLATSVDFNIDSMIYDSGVIISNVSSHQVGITLVDETTYYIRVKVRDSYGLWSNYGIGSFVLDLTHPFNPYINIVEGTVFNQDIIHVKLSIDGTDSDTRYILYETFTNLSENAVIGDLILTVDDVEDRFTVGQVVTLYETKNNGDIVQHESSIVTFNRIDHTITLANALEEDFTTDAVLMQGQWKQLLTVTNAYEFIPNTLIVEELRTIYVRFRDAAWNEPEIAGEVVILSDSITIDKVEPHAEIAVVHPTPLIFDIDREVTKFTGDSLGRNILGPDKINDLTETNLISLEAIFTNPVNLNANVVYYLYHKDLRKKTGMPVGTSGICGTEPQFNDGIVEFYLTGNTEPITFIVDATLGKLTFSRPFNNIERSSGIFISYRYGKQKLYFTKDFIRRNPANRPVDVDIYDFLGEPPLPIDIVVTGTTKTVSSVISSENHTVGGNIVTLGAVVFSEPVTMQELGSLTYLKVATEIGDQILKVVSAFGFFVGEDIYIGSDVETAYEILAINTNTGSNYDTITIDQELEEVEYPINTVIKTVNEVKVDYYYGERELVVNSTRVTFALNADNASQVYIDGDIIREVGYTKEWVAYSEEKSVTLNPLVGSEFAKGYAKRNVYFNFKDAAGNTTGSISIPGGVWFDNRIPTETSAELQEGSVTNTQLVHLLVEATGAVDILIQGDVDPSQNNVNDWIPYTTDPILLQLTDFDGVKNIQVYFRGEGGNITQPELVQVTLDTTIPIGSGKRIYFRVAGYF